MFFQRGFRNRILLAIVFALLLGQVFTLSKQYIDNYLHSDGFKLANGNLVGGDFITFYQAGLMVREEPELLYDFAYYISRQKEFYKLHSAKEDVLVFAYPPLVAYLFDYLPRTTLLQAYLCWTSISMFLFFASLTLILRSVGASIMAILIAAFAGLGFYSFSLSCLAAGQTSAIGTAILTGFYLTFQKGRYFLAGLILSLSYYKPPLFVGLVLTLCFARSWRVLYGFFVGGSSLVLMTVATFGYDNFINFIKVVSGYRYGQSLVGDFSLPIDKGVGIVAALEGLKLFSSSGIQVFSLLLVLIISFYLGNSHLRKIENQCNFKYQHSLMLFTLIISFSLICSLQMVAYDLTLLFPFLAAITYSLQSRQIKGPSIILFLLSFLALFYEYGYRSLEFANIVIKGTTVVWILLTLSVFTIFNKIRKRRE